MTITVRTYTLTTNNGIELGTFTSPTELGKAFVAHFGKGYTGLAGKLVDAIEHGKSTAFLEKVLGVTVESRFDTLAA